MTSGIALLNLPARRAASPPCSGRWQSGGHCWNYWFPKNSTTIEIQGSGGYSCPQASDRLLERGCRETEWLTILIVRCGQRWQEDGLYLTSACPSSRSTSSLQDHSHKGGTWLCLSPLILREAQWRAWEGSWASWSIHPHPLTHWAPFNWLSGCS